jgi:hypothetical protein
MQRHAILSLALLLLVGHSIPAHACTWVGLSQSNVERELPGRVASADTIVHGRVVSIGNDGLAAQIKVVHLFKGTGETLNLESGLVCGHIFKVGDEAIYFISKSHVSAPTVYPVSKWLASSLAKATKTT